MPRRRNDDSRNRGVRFRERAESSDVASANDPTGFHLDGKPNLAVLLDEQVDFGAIVRSPTGRDLPLDLARELTGILRRARFHVLATQVDRELRFLAGPEVRTRRGALPRLAWTEQEARTLRWKSEIPISLSRTGPVFARLRSA